MIKFIISAAVVFAVVFATGWYERKQGLVEGLRAYHQLCYQGDHIVVDKDTQTVVQCSPMGTLPELQQAPLDKGTRV